MRPPGQAVLGGEFACYKGLEAQRPLLSAQCAAYYRRRYTGQATPATQVHGLLAVLAAVFQVLGLPAPGNSIDQTDALRAYADALRPPKDGLFSEYVSLAAAIDSGITQALREGAKNPEVVSAADFGPSGLLFVQLPPSPYQFLRGVRGHDSGISGLGVEAPVSVRGLATAVSPGHHLLTALPPSSLVQSAAGPVYVLGAAVMEGPALPRLPNWWLVRDVVQMTVQVREAQLREAEHRRSEEQWREATKRADAALRKTPAELKAEAELAEQRRQTEELRRQVAELKKEKGEAGC
jgi:hypothetical protein